MVMGIISFMIFAGEDYQETEHFVKAKAYIERIVQLSKADDLKLKEEVDINKISTRERNSFSFERLDMLLKKIDFTKAKVLVSPFENGVCIFRIMGDVNIDFELEKREGEYILVGVTP